MVLGLALEVIGDLAQAGCVGTACGIVGDGGQGVIWDVARETIGNTAWQVIDGLALRVAGGTAREIVGDTAREMVGDTAQASSMSISVELIFAEHDFFFFFFFKTEEKIPSIGHRCWGIYRM